MLKKIKENMSNIAFARNSYSAITGVIVIVIVLVLNLMLQQMVGTSWSIDMSDLGIYDITETSIEMLEELDSEVTFTILAVETDVDDVILTFIDKYTALSDNITIEWIDPILYPTALETYNTSVNTIVVSCEETGKSTIVSIGDIFYLDEMSYYYYGEYIYYFDGEGLFTSAISQVSNPVEYTMYTVTGHGEETMSDTVYELLGKNSVTTSSLNLLTTTEIPDDCDLLAVIGPTADITEDEKTVLSDYLLSGGNILVMMGGTTDTDFTNLESLLEEYGLELADGYIADTDRAYQGNGYYMIPNISVSGDMAIDITTSSVLLINSRGFSEIDAARDTIDLDVFMYTSTNGYAVTDVSEVQGTYVLGAIATEEITLDDETTAEARLTVYGSSNLILEEVTSAFTTLENTTLFMNSVMENFEGSTNVSIESIIIQETYNVVENANGLSLIFLVIIPMTVLIMGFVVWNDRRKH